VTAPDGLGPEQSGPNEAGLDGPPHRPGGESPDGPPQGPEELRVPEERAPASVSKGPEQADSPPDPDSEADELVLAQTALAERTLDLQRLQAEYLNYKRRVDRDRELIRQNAVFAVLQNLLPVLDDIDRAREHGELEGGFRAVADSLERTVSGLGLTKYGASGDEFDPTLHEALMHGHSPEVTTTTVDVVAHAGYRIGDRVVRAAKVTVLDPETSDG
jgi:molecular chaperone GrpE